MHRDHRDQHADGQHDDRHQRAAQVQQEHEADECHDDALFDQGPAQILDGPVDEIGTIVDRLQRDALLEAGSDLRDLGVEIVDDIECILAVPRHGDARHNLAFSVEFRDAPSLVGPQFYARHVPDEHRHTLFRLEHEIFDVRNAAQVAAATDDEFRFRHFDHPAAHVAVARADHLGELVQRNSVRLQFARVHGDLIRLHKAADASHFGHALGLGQLIADEPVLDGP